MLETQSSKEFRGDEIKLGLYAGNAEISDTVNLLIFEACLAGFDVYVYGAVRENLSVPAM